MISVIWIPFKEIYILFRIINEYKKTIPNDEEEKAIQKKNYTHLVLFGIIQIITFGFYVAVLVIQVINGSDALFPLPLIILILYLLFIVTHILFLFFFIYDEDSYKTLKRIMLCRRKEVLPDAHMISNILINENNE